MSETLTWEDVDRDGAIEEAAAAVVGETRAGLLRKAAFGAGAVVASGGVAGALANDVFAATPPASDIAILNFALTLEFLEAEFYTQADRNNRLTGQAELFAGVVGAHERTHVNFLMKALGKKAVKKPKFDFKDTVTNQQKFLQTARVLEDTGVQAYLGQVANIKTKSILRAAGTIVTVEARHAAWVRDIIGKGSAPLPAPASFDAPKSKNQILAAVKGTGFIVG